MTYKPVDVEGILDQLFDEISMELFCDVERALDTQAAEIERLRADIAEWDVKAGAKLAAENKRLTDVIDNAPHEFNCKRYKDPEIIKFPPDDYCDCWKQAALKQESNE